MINARLKGVVLVAAAAAAVTIGTGAAHASGVAPCPSGYACLYDNIHTGDAPTEYYHYGSYNLNNVTGTHRFTNNQTGGAKAYLCTGYNGTGSCQLVPAGQTVTRDFGPINSIYLHA